MEIVNETTTSETNTSDQERTGDGSGDTQTETRVSAPETGGGQDDGGLQKTAGGTETAVTPNAEVYTPNFKFKVKDKELEIEDYLKPIIKTKDLETKIKELHEKAHGLDEVKTSRDTFKTQAEEWKGKYTQVDDGLNLLGEYVKKKDYRSFFEAINIPKEDIIRYAIEELKFQELPPEQKATIEQQRQQQLFFQEQQVQNQTLQQQMGAMVLQQATNELTQELARPDVASLANAYDTRAGKPGAFKAEVIKRGQYYEAVHKVSPPASQLVAEILSFVGVNANDSQNQQATSQSMSSQTTQPKQKPVISSFQSGAQKSPVRKAPQSIDDLRKMRQNLQT